MTALNNYLGARGPAYAVSPGEIEVAPKLHLEPDVLVFPSTFRPGTRWTEIDGWWLAVEALSASSKHYDRDYKLAAYLHVGVEEVWIVDLDRHCCEISGVDGRRSIAEYQRVRWRPSGMTQPLELDLDTIFRDIP